MRKKRVVSLLPAATEMVCALVAAGQLAGRSHECDYPPEILALPACTSARLDATAESGDIERQVKKFQQEGESLYQLDAEKLKGLRPDIILTQGQCEVCAISLVEVESAVKQWPGRQPQIISLSPNRLADIWTDIRTVSEALDLGEHGREVLRAFKMRVVDIIEKSCVLKQRPTVACVEWIEPLMAAGNWVPELVELAGGANVAGEPGKHSSWMEWETLVKLNPEIIIAMPCGFDLMRTRTEMAALARRLEWPKLQAVKNRRVFVTDGNQYFNRPGPRIVESLEMLTEMIHPDRFNFGHRGKGWEKFAGSDAGQAKA
jgi:iron complex transport system substrate-binding protein